MRKLTLASLVIFAFLFLTVPMASVMAADGTTGTIDYDQTSVAEDTLVYVHFEGLGVSSDYQINTDNNVTQFAFTTGASQTDIYVPVKFAMPADGNNDFILTLVDGSEAVTIDSITVYITAADTILDSDAFLTIAVPLIVIALVVSIIVGITVKKK